MVSLLCYRGLSCSELLSRLKGIETRKSSCETTAFHGKVRNYYPVWRELKLISRHLLSATLLSVRNYYPVWRELKQIFCFFSLGQYFSFGTTIPFEGNWNLPSPTMSKPVIYSSELLSRLKGIETHQLPLGSLCCASFGTTIPFEGNRNSGSIM